MRSYAISRMNRPKVKTRSHRSSRTTNTSSYVSAPVQKGPPPKPTDYSSEARQAPTSNDHTFVFPWDAYDVCLEIPDDFDIRPAEGRITIPQINAFLKELHCMELAHLKREPVMPFLGICTLLISMPLFMTYLILGLATKDYQFEIKQDDEKRYIDFEAPISGLRIVDSVLISLAIAISGIVAMVLICFFANNTEENRRKRRLFVMKKIVQKHQDSSFAGTGCTLSCSEFGSYVKITMDWKVPMPEPANVSASDPKAQHVISALTNGQNDPPTSDNNNRSAAEHPLKPPEKTEVPKVPEVKDHPEAVSIQVPEEQPL